MGCSFCETAKKLTQVYCFKKFVWVGKFAPIINRQGVGIRMSWVEENLKIN